VIRPLRRRRGDPQPDSPRAVLLVPLGGRASPVALRSTRDLADGGPVAVLALLKIYGYALGMPNPGLLPTVKEKKVQTDVVAHAIGRLEKMGCEADGQVAMTRHPARVIASVARTRGVHHVVIEQPAVGRVRKALEGDLVASVRRRLGADIEVVVLDAVTASPVAAPPRRK
jgi:hypothetical protein